MPKPVKGPRLGGSPAHQRLILRNLATQLFEHGRITTTERKARLLRPYAEKLITKAKKGDLHNRRLVLRELFTGVDRAAEAEGVLVVNKYAQHKLFTEIAPSFAERPGGYTRITKIGPRKGDNAPMAVIALVTEAYAPANRSTPATKEQPVSTSDDAPAPVAESDEPTLVDESARAEEAGDTPAASPTDEDPAGSETGTDDVAEEASEGAEPAPGTDDPQAQAAAEDAAPAGEGDKSV